MARSAGDGFLSPMGVDTGGTTTPNSPKWCIYLRMNFPSEVMDITKNPLTTGLLREIGIMMISKNLANLIHKFSFGLGRDFDRLVCFILKNNIINYI